MAQTTFFGLTSYGAGTAYDKTVARALQFHQIPDDVFLDLFHKHALGHSELALLLGVRLSNDSCSLNARFLDSYCAI